MDIVFLQDVTGSQGVYIHSVKESIMEICYFIKASGKVNPEQLRLGLVAFRDYEDKDSTFLIRNFGFTTDAKVMQQNLAGLTAEGGHDAPEAIEAALDAAFRIQWNPKAVKFVVLITDAAPHGIGEDGDHFSKGSPLGYNPLELARGFGSYGVVVYIMACEPTLGSGYKYAADYYCALAEVTSGAVYSLAQPSLLSSCIIGSALERLELEKLSYNHQAEIARMFEEKKSINEITNAIHSRMRAKGEKAPSVDIGTLYRDSSQARHNCAVFATSPSLADAVPKLQAVPLPRHKYSSFAPESSQPFRVTVTNTGTASLVLKMWGQVFESEANPTEERTFAPGSERSLIVPLNATRVFGIQWRDRTKMFARTFSTPGDAVLDLKQLWESTA